MILESEKDRDAYVLDYLRGILAAAHEEHNSDCKARLGHREVCPVLDCSCPAQVNGGDLTEELCDAIHVLAGLVENRGMYSDVQHKKEG